MEASEVGAAGAEIAAVFCGERGKNLYAVPIPPANPRIRIADASAG
jgi:hypothetical protein